MIHLLDPWQIVSFTFSLTRVCEWKYKLRP